MILKHPVALNWKCQPALTGWVVVEGNYEALTALVCQPH